MELWLTLAILCYASHAISSTIDKTMMNRGNTPLTVNSIKMLYDGIILLIIGAVFFNLRFTVDSVLWALLLGGLYAISGILYFNTLKLKDAAVAIPYLQSATLLLTFLGSVLFLHENPNAFNYAGIVLIFMGVYALFIEKGVRLPKMTRTFFIMAGAIIVMTIYSLLAKNLVDQIEPINLAIMMYFSSALFLFFYIVAFKKHDGTKIFKSPRLIIAAFFGAMGTFLLYSALQVGEASQVYPIAGLQSVFIFLLASFFLKEKFYWHRLAGVITVVIGIYLISI
jgi:drug/metabolite transporter (DMT)-like permease